MKQSKYIVGYVHTWVSTPGPVNAIESLFCHEDQLSFEQLRKARHCGARQKTEQYTERAEDPYEYKTLIPECPHQSVVFNTYGKKI